MRALLLTLVLSIAPALSFAGLNPLFLEQDEQAQMIAQNILLTVAMSGEEICKTVPLDDQARSERDLRFFMIGTAFNEATRQLEEERNIDLATDGTLKKLSDLYIISAYEALVVTLCSDRLDDR